MSVNSTKKVYNLRVDKALLTLISTVLNGANTIVAYFIKDPVISGFGYIVLNALIVYLAAEAQAAPGP